MRVVSLLPSATEIVYALGVEPVATSHECDYPPAADELPTVVESTIDTDASSGDIDEQVRQAEREGGVYEIDREALRAADPDLVIAQGICEVCAVDTVLVEEAIAELDLDCELLTTDPHRLSDVFDDIHRIGVALDREAEAADLLERLERRIERVVERVPAGVAGAVADDIDDPSGVDELPDVAVLDWLDPVMVAAHWMPEVATAAGGEYPLAETGERSRPREWVEILDVDPDVLVLSPCGFTLDRIEATLDDVRSRPGWDELTAVQRASVFLMDGHNYVNRPGPRLIDTIEHLVGALHPDLTPDHCARPPSSAVRPLTTSQE